MSENNDDDFRDDDDDDDDANDIYNEFDKILSKYEPTNSNFYDEDICEIFEEIMDLVLAMIELGTDAIKLQIRQQILDKKLCICISLK